MGGNCHILAWEGISIFLHGRELSYSCMGGNCNILAWEETAIFLHGMELPYSCMGGNCHILANSLCYGLPL